jgi:hypothetical protein
MSSGETIMPWGKHSGKCIADIPSDYLKWIYDISDADDDLKEASEQEYFFRERFRTHFYE